MTDTKTHTALSVVCAHTVNPTIQEQRAEIASLRRENARLDAGLKNRYLRSVLNLVDKHRDLDFTSVEVLVNNLTLTDEDASTEEYMLDQLIDMPFQEKLAIIPYLTALGYWVTEMREEGGQPNYDCPFSVHRNTNEQRLRRVYADSFARGSVLHAPTLDAVSDTSF